MKNLYLVITVLLYTSTYSQQALKEFYITTRDNDGTSVVQGNVSFPDNAVVFVYSPLKDLNFRSSVGGVSQVQYNNRANRYEILITPQKQILFVFAAEFIEQRIDIINPTPKQVFYYQIEERSGQDEIPVIFQVEPVDAKLFLDNISFDINKTIRAPKGAVQVRIEREGYRSVDEVITISEERVNYDFKLTVVDMAPVRIRSNVPQAKLVIDNVERDQMDQNGAFDLFLYPGIYTLELQMSGYLSQSQTFEVVEDKENVLQFELTKNSGYILFDIIPKNASIQINKKLHDGSPEAEVIPGNYRIDISAPGYHSIFEAVEIKLGERITVNKELVQKVGSLQFSASPSDARVVMRNDDSKIVERWNGLKIINDLPVGRYTLSVSYDGYTTTNQIVNISEGEREIIKVVLSESTSRKKKSVSLSQIREEAQMIHFTMMPSNATEGTILLNSNYGFRYSKVKKHGFFVDFNLTFNFSSPDLVLENNILQSETDLNAQVQFEQIANVRSHSVGFGYVYNPWDNIYVSFGASYYNYQLRQRANMLQIISFIDDEPVYDIARQDVLVMLSDVAYSGLVFNAGLMYNFDKYSLGCNLGNFYPSNIAFQIMLGVNF